MNIKLMLTVVLIFQNIHASNNGDYTVMECNPKRLAVDSEECFCGWFFCLKQPLCCPTKQDCRFYACCAPCARVADITEQKFGTCCAILCCPCIATQNQMG